MPLTPERIAQIREHVHSPLVDELLSDLDVAQNALKEVEKTGGALAMLLHPEMGLPMPSRDELVATIQAMNRTCRDALQSNAHDPARGG